MVKRPDPLESTPPAFGEQAARQILRDAFGVESSSLKPLAGERDQNFRVDTAAGQRFLLKVSNPADDGPVLAMQAAALRHIEQVDPDLPVMRARPAAAGEPWVEVPGPDGRTYPARLFTFLPGQAAANTALTTEAIWSHGQVTARLGRALRGFFHPAADYEILWDITRVPKLRPLLTHVSDGHRRGRSTLRDGPGRFGPGRAGPCRASRQLQRRYPTWTTCCSAGPSGPHDRGLRDVTMRHWSAISPSLSPTCCTAVTTPSRRPTR